MRKWSKAEEDVFAENPYWAYRYAREVLGARWRRSEEVIAKSPKWALEYAKWVIRGRFELAEPYIKGSWYEHEYVEFIRFRNRIWEYRTRSRC